MSFLRQTQNVQVLPFQSLGGIQYQKTYIRFLQSTNGPHHRIKLKILFNFSLFSDPGCIDQHEFLPEFIVNRVNRIPGGAGNRGDNIPVFT